MIEIKRDPADKTRLLLCVGGIEGAKKTWELTFTHKLTSEYEADVTEKLILDTLQKAMRKLRFACYDRGVRDGRGHRARLNLASSVPNSLNLSSGIWEDVP